MRRMTKGLLLALLLATFGMVSPVGAVPPDREPVSAEPPITLVGQCDFDVLLEDVINKEKITTFFDQEGNERFSLITGALKVRVTNLDTGTSKVLNVSGPARFDPHPDGSLTITTRGATFLYFFPGDDTGGLPLLAFAHGQTVLEIDAEGALTVTSVRGDVQDACELLADS